MKGIILGSFGILFVIGILLILGSASWNLGSMFSMNLAGTIISIFSGVGFLCERYLDKSYKK